MANAGGFGDWVTSTFHGPLSKLFNPIDVWLTPIPEMWWKISAVGLFVGAMAWVFSLNRAYVDLDRPNRHVWTDLRVWTVVSMLPHVIVYLWF
ncbi:MAG: hypothetical protein ABGZ35_24210 [Planctomycetaceae bacterium]